MPDDLMPLERYAEALAYAREYPAEDHGAIFARLGTSTARVNLSQEHWSREVGAHLSSGDPTLMLELSSRYLRAIAGIRLRRPEVAEIAPDGSLTPVRPSATVVRPPERRPAPAQVQEEQARPKEVPSYLLPPPKHKLMQGLADSSTAAAHQIPDEDLGNRTEALPQAEMVARMIAESDPRAAMARAAAGLPAPIRSAPPTEDNAAGTGTAVAPLPDELARRAAALGAGAVPFRADASPSPKSPGSLGTGTVFAPSTPKESAATPFKAGPPSARVAPIGAGSPPKEPISTGTILAPMSASEGPTTPFRNERTDDGLQGGAREMTLEQYVFVSATLRAASPTDLPAVLARFRLTTETRRELEAAWKARMQADPSLAIRYSVLLADQARSEK